jgi:uncharacterized protein YacL
MFENIANFSHTSDYLPILNSVLITDLFVILLMNLNIIKSRVLKEWYDKYNVSAIVCDILIIFIGIIIARYLYYKIFKSYSLYKFVGLAVCIQVIHDILFYQVVKSIPRGAIRMVDTFKDYGKEVSYKAILSDSGMMIMASILSSYLIGKNLNTNLIVLIVSMYSMPYLLYT